MSPTGPQQLAATRGLHKHADIPTALSLFCDPPKSTSKPSEALTVPPCLSVTTTRQESKRPSAPPSPQLFELGQQYHLQVLALETGNGYEGKVLCRVEAAGLEKGSELFLNLFEAGLAPAARWLVHFVHRHDELIDACTYKPGPQSVNAQQKWRGVPPHLSTATEQTVDLLCRQLVAAASLHRLREPGPYQKKTVLQRGIDRTRTRRKVRRKEREANSLVQEQYISHWPLQGGWRMLLTSRKQHCPTTSGHLDSLTVRCAHSPGPSVTRRHPPLLAPLRHSALPSDHEASNSVRKQSLCPS